MQPNPPVSELKPYLPAKDFEISKRFYTDLGFTLEWVGPDNALACFKIDSLRFLLQQVGPTFRPDYFMMHWIRRGLPAFTVDCTGSCVTQERAIGCPGHSANRGVRILFLEARALTG